MDSSIFADSSSTLVPLMQVHGVPPVFRMLQALPGLQIWTVPTSYLSPADHVLLEDAASCLLQIQHGVATLLQRGIRVFNDKPYRMCFRHHHNYNNNNNKKGNGTSRQ
jgi:hypothetical protein